MKLIEVKDVVKQYSGHRALDGVSLDVPKGTIYGLLGPNGAGKTTLIRIINCITAPDSGEVLLNGKKLQPEDVRLIGYLPEERGLYKKMKVGEQAVYLARLKGMTKQQLKTELDTRLKQYLTDPVVTVRHINFNISILGDVGSPGQKTSSTERLNIFQALALAGDMRDSANRTNVKLIRYSEESGKDITYNLDLSEASIVNSPYYYLQQNDILYVEPDKNKQIAANTTNPNRGLFLQLMGVVLGLVTFVIALAR